MKQRKLALLGFGNAGRAFAKLLLSKHEAICRKYDTDVKVTAISTNSRGCLYDPSGLNLVKALQDIEQDGKFDSSSSAFCNLSSIEIAETADYDILLELTPLNIFTGQPAIRHIEAAFKRNKHAITANKGPIAWAYNELKEMAKTFHCLFYYETTVMDGTPIFNLKDYTLDLCRVTEVQGILNSTTNFILEELAKGRDSNEVMEEGRKRGFIEADSSMDIEGWDAAAKTAALLNVLMDAGITPEDVDRQGIDGIKQNQIQAAAQRGKVIKLLCSGTIENGSVRASVKPAEIDCGSLYAGIDGTSSVVSITTDLMGTISIVEHIPEIEQTAYGIFSDVLRAVKAIKSGGEV